MTDTNTTPAAAADAKAPKPLTVIDDMDSRRLFDTTTQAIDYITKCRAEYTDFDGYPVAAVGLGADEQGNLVMDEKIYTDEMRVAVSVLTKRGEGAGKSTVQAIVIYPSPKLEAIMTSATGTAWLTAIMEKELNHVAVRNLRKAESEDDIVEAIQTMPTTVENFTTSGRESTGGILETYNTLWQLIKKGVGEKSKAFALANLSKKELRKAMESASYASAVYPTLENRTNKAGEPASWFLMAIMFGQALAKAQTLDAAIFDKMLATRNEKKIDAAADDEQDDFDFDFDAMAAAVAKKDETPATPATDAPAPDATPPAAE